MPTAGVGRSTVLTGVSQVDLDAQVSASFDKPATGTGADLILTGRYVSSGNEYRAHAKVRPTGAVQLAIRRFLGGSATSLTAVEVPGLTYSVGQQLRIRRQVEGTSPTTLRATVWLVGQAEPASWHVQTTDSGAALQAAGGVGLVCYLSGSATNAPLTASFDDLAVTPLG